MKTLTSKFFQVLERNISLKEFENWLSTFENVPELKDDEHWNTFFNFNFASKSVNYEFSKLLSKFDLDEYAPYKFENTLKQILSDGNLFRIVRSAHDFNTRYEYPIFGRIGDFDTELQNEFLSYENTRQKLVATAEGLWQQWNSLKTPDTKLAFLKGRVPVHTKLRIAPDSAYIRFYGRMWKFWNN